MLVDVHAHLTHEKLASQIPQIVDRCQRVGVERVIVNGLNPQSNRQVLELCRHYPILRAALGIYPIDAVNSLSLIEDLPFEVARFSVDDEIAFIRQQALDGNLTAIGECGLDGYWVGEEAFEEQDRVFEGLIEVALEADLPLIIHTRKRERRAMEILVAHGVKRVDFHCFGGRSKHAQQWAETHGWCFSIPANARRNQSFTKMLRTLPEECILTETDCPYLAPEPGQPSEPCNVKGTVVYLAELRGWEEARASELVLRNYQRLFTEH